MNFFFTILVILVLVFIGNQVFRNDDSNIEISEEIKCDTLSSNMETQTQYLDGENTRSENLKLIESILKDLQESGSLGEDPLILINEETFIYKEFVAGKDTISILGKGKVSEIGFYSKKCEQEIRKTHKKPGNTGILEVEISLDKE